MAEGVNKSDLIREALKKGFDRPRDIRDWVKRNHGEEVTSGLIGGVKKAWLENQAEKSVTRKSSAPAHTRAGGSDSISFKDLEKIAAVVEAMGIDKVQKALNIMK